MKAGWLRYSEGFGVNQGDKSFRTTPDAFGARGCKLWELIKSNRDRLVGLGQDDIRLTALYMDLLCVGISTYQNNVIKDREGRTWPRHPDLDINNPLGLEVVPQVGSNSVWHGSLPASLPGPRLVPRIPWLVPRAPMLHVLDHSVVAPCLQLGRGFGLPYAPSRNGLALLR